MTLLLASVLMAVAIGVAVIHPILARRVALVRDVTAGSVLDAEARKRVALTELKEIEYDYLGGKLDDADYHALRERISVEALAAIRAVDVAHADDPVAVAVSRAEAPHVCGYANPAGSRFCGGCGAGLA